MIELLKSHISPNLPISILCLCISGISGHILGRQREKVGHGEAGERTMTLVSIGSTLFTIIPMLAGFGTETWRVAANVVTGIGFIGAGVLLKDGINIKGLTTSTTIWVCAALGVCYGSCNINNIIVGIIVTIITYIVLNKKKIKHSTNEGV